MGVQSPSPRRGRGGRTRTSLPGIYAYQAVRWWIVGGLGPSRPSPSRGLYTPTGRTRGVNDNAGTVGGNLCGTAALAGEVPRDVVKDAGIKAACCTGGRILRV
jgi:hypothetical protein